MNENNNLYREKPKNKYGQGLLTGILITIIICLIAFIVYDKVLTNNDNDNNQQVENNNQTGNDNNQVENNDNQNDDTNTEDENKEEVTELSLTSTLVNSLSNIFYGKYLDTGASEYDNYFYKQDKTTIATVPDKLKMVITFKSLGNPENISKTDFEIAYKQIFGNTATVPSISRIDECFADYELVNDYYKHPETVGGCGGTTSSATYSKLIKAVQTKTSTSDKIVISEAVAFANPGGSYKDINHKQLVEANGGENPLNGDYSKYAQYDYTFVKDTSGIYVFTSVEKIK